MPAWEEYKKHAKERGALAMEVYVAVSTPVAEPEVVLSHLSDHLAYIRSIEASGDLMFAGPLSDLTGEKMEAKGMLVFRAKSLDHARELAENDPMHKTGAREFELRRWMINEGGFQLDVKLSAQSVRFSVD
jgi:uncharacterized protein